MSGMNETTLIAILFFPPFPSWASWKNVIDTFIFWINALILPHGRELMGKVAHENSHA